MGLCLYRIGRSDHNKISLSLPDLLPNIFNIKHKYVVTHGKTSITLPAIIVAS
jgi:hypothetical protein